MSQVASEDDMKSWAPYSDPIEAMHWKIDAKQFSSGAVLRLYFEQFDEALSRGSGVYDYGMGLQTDDPEIQSKINQFESVFHLGKAVLDEWHAQRGERIGLAEYLDNGGDVFDAVAKGIVSGEADRLFNCGEALRGIEIGPSLLTLLGAPPGRGKTALAMQAVYEAVKHEERLNVVVASLEVSAEMLLKRRIAMLLGVGFNQVRFNTLTQYQRQQLNDATVFQEFRETLSRVGFLKSEKSGLGDLLDLLHDSKEPGLLLLDYVQLFGSMDHSAQDRAIETMALARRFCDEGWGVIAVSAVSRASYSKAELGAFRDSSALEYSGTAGYMLDESETYKDAGDKPAIRPMKLRCVKNRNGPPKDLELLFNGPQMLFSAPLPPNECEGDFDEWNSGAEAQNPFEVPA
ncbi:MAG: DnaB-like helicase C-terminal domain-containing protein [Planctomycetota bacterium]